MANMKLIEAKTLGSNQSSVTFSDIPNTYTDLMLKVSARSADAGNSDSLAAVFNTVTSGYTNILLYGTGTTTGSVMAYTNKILVGELNASSSGSNIYCNAEMYITNYGSSVNYKSTSCEAVQEKNASTGNNLYLVTGQWANANPITNIQLLTASGSNLAAGSTFYLYGISSVTEGSKATGGIVSYDSTYYYHMFPYSGTFTATESITADILVVAGGGGGGGIDGAGRTAGGGGGAGGYLEQTGRSVSVGSYAITVGAGGAKGVTGPSASPSSITAGSVGNNSVFDTSTALGGGGGAASGIESQTNATTGGSGGGGVSFGGPVNKNGAAATQGNSGGATGYGFAGGNGTNGSSYQAGAGGGGAGGAGGNSISGADANAGTAGVGGQGRQSSITGISTYYAAGGAGGNEGNSRTNTESVNNIGGQSATGSGQQATSGVVNTGSGGGGACGQGTGVSVQAGAGASGIVIIRYAI